MNDKNNSNHHHHHHSTLMNNYAHNKNRNTSILTHSATHRSIQIRNDDTSMPNLNILKSNLLQLQHKRKMTLLQTLKNHNDISYVTTMQKQSVAKKYNHYNDTHNDNLNDYIHYNNNEFSIEDEYYNKLLMRQKLITLQSISYNEEKKQLSLQQETGNYDNYEDSIQPNTRISSYNNHCFLQNHHFHNHQLKPNIHHFAKDYIQLAKEYKKMKVYQNNNPKLKMQCIICKRKAETKPITSLSNLDGHSSHRRHLTKVLFPCEHRPICNVCWDDAMKSMSSLSSPNNNVKTKKTNHHNDKYWWTKKCPVCNEEIKITFDHTDTFTEIDQYWEWAHEIKPMLSHGFRKSFLKCSKQFIRESMLKSIQEVSRRSSDDINYIDSDNKTEKMKQRSSFHNKDIIQSKACVIQ